MLPEQDISKYRLLDTTPSGAGARLTPDTLSVPAIRLACHMAKIFDLPTDTATITLGNPQIVVVTMLKRNAQAVITGLAPGETQLTAHDAGGKGLGEMLVRVECGGPVRSPIAR